MLIRGRYLLTRLDQINSVRHELIKKPYPHTGIKVITDSVNPLKKAVHDNEFDIENSQRKD